MIPTGMMVRLPTRRHKRLCKTLAIKTDDQKARPIGRAFVCFAWRLSFSDIDLAQTR